MKIISWKYIIPFFLSGVFFLSSKPLLAQIARPKLVIGIVVDQMRWDYLYRFESKYSLKGFKRLIKEGFNCQQTFVNYVPSFTAPGHASIYTGSIPALNGIVGNEWFDHQSGALQYCTEDSMVVAVGGSEDAGKMSPRNLLSTTITDELRLATNFQSRVISLSLKDRGAILPAGHTGNAAYWYDTKSGEFMTSSYYRKDLPNWLLNFNKRNIPDSLMSGNWQTLLPLATYTESSVDENPYEGTIKGEQMPVFPHLTSHLSTEKKRSALRYTPYGNTVLCMLAEDCIKEEQLGQKGSTDFLALSFSATDYAGHLFGPNSIEVEDIYLRLDQDIAGLLNFLDQQIGQGNYLVFLTSDHAAAQNALYMQQNKIPANSLSIKELKHRLNHYLYSVYKDSNLVRSLYNYQVFLNHSRINSLKIDASGLLKHVQNWLKNQDGVTGVYNLTDGSENNAPEPLGNMIKNGYFRNRCGSLQIILNPQWYSGYGATGTSHGGWNPYDTHIPLIWYGWHVPNGESFQKNYITDIAATLAAMLHIQMPDACVGKVIEPLAAYKESGIYSKKK